jgi:glutathione S-transferase
LHVSILILAKDDMKLYQANWSPFPTRVRLVIYAKGLEVEMIDPEGFNRPGRAREAYEKVNPVMRIPTLILDDGTALPESEVICEYLEDAYPEPSLRPKDPKDLARVRLLSRLSDIYVVMAMNPLFAFSAQKRTDRDQTRIGKALASLTEALGYLEHYIGQDGYAVGTSLTQADGALIPILQLSKEWTQDVFGTPDPMAGLPKLEAYWNDIQRDPIAARVLQETREAIAAYRDLQKKAAMKT